MWVNEAYEVSSNSSYKFVGDPKNLELGLYNALEFYRKELVAMRSGFNDDRHETNPLPLNDLGTLPKEVLDTFLTIEETDIKGDDVQKIPPSGNLFTDIAIMATSEIDQMSTTLSKISVKSQASKARLAAANKVEKQKKLLESLNNLPDSVNKERIKTAVSEGDLSALLSSPSNEEKEKKSTFDRDGYEIKAVECANKIINIERTIG